MQHLNVSDNIIAKAKELKIHPKLLLVSLAAIHDKVSEVKALDYYIKSVADDMKEQAERQLQHKKDSMREAGEMALTIADEDFIKGLAGNSELSLKLFFDLNKPVEKYKLIAYQHMLTNLLKLFKAGAIAGIYKKDGGMLASYFPIIKHFCKDELQDFNQLAGIFNQDISLQ